MSLSGKYAKFFQQILPMNLNSNDLIQIILTGINLSYHEKKEIGVLIFIQVEESRLLEALYVKPLPHSINSLLTP